MRTCDKCGQDFENADGSGWCPHCGRGQGEPAEIRSAERFRAFVHRTLVELVRAAEGVEGVDSRLNINSPCIPIHDDTGKIVGHERHTTHFIFEMTVNQRRVIAS